MITFLYLAGLLVARVLGWSFSHDAATLAALGLVLTVAADLARAALRR